MNMIGKTLLLSAASFLLWGCIGVKDAEEDTILDVGADSIELEAEFISGTDTTVTVLISSNRSWFAHLDDLDHPVDPTDPSAHVRWGKLSVEYHSNLTNTTDETELVITFNRNYSYSQVNGVLNIYCEGEICKSIPVIQKGAVYHVSAEAESATADCNPDTVRVAVDCNIWWSARIEEESTADVRIDVPKGTGEGYFNVIFGGNDSVSEEKTAKITVSAANCPPAEVVIIQNRNVPYVALQPDSDTRIVAGDSRASVAVKSNCAWTAEVLSSELEDFAIVNPSSEGAEAAVRNVEFTFKANPSENPFDIKRAVVRFHGEGAEKPLDITLSQRGVFVVSFADMSAFDPEIPDTLNRGNTHPDPKNFNNNLSRPGKVNTDVDVFRYTCGEISMDIEMSKYMNYDKERAALYIMGAGKLPHIRFSGIEGLSLRKLSLGCVAKDAGAVHFAGNIVADDHKLASKETVEYTGYISQLKWPTVTDGSLHYIDFDLSENGVLVEEGRGCTLRTSNANDPKKSSENITKMYIKTVTLKYL